jgi:hypothetical protein
MAFAHPTVQTHVMPGVRPPRAMKAVWPDSGARVLPHCFLVQPPSLRCELNSQRFPRKGV